MEEQQDKSKADLDEEDSRIDSSKLSINTKENVQCTLKSTSDMQYSPCANTYIVNEGKADNTVKKTTSKPLRCSTPTEDKEIITSNMATNQDRISPNVVYRSDESEDEDDDEDDNMMTIIEKVIKDFDERSRLENNRQKNASLELINLSKSSDETEDRNDRIEAMMSWNPDETKKFQTLKIPEVDQNQDSEEYSRKPESVHIFSDNSLLKEATSQLRLKFKLFFSDLDLKTNTLRSPQKNFISPYKCLSGSYGNKASVCATNGPKMSVLQIIEVSRRTRRKQLASLRKSTSKKSNVPFTKHFDTDGTCCRNNGHDDVLTILSKDLEHRRDLKSVLSNLLIELQKCERFVVNISLQKEDEVKDITDRQDELCDRLLYSKQIKIKEEIRFVECKTLMKHMDPKIKFVLPKRKLKKTYHYLRIRIAQRKRTSGSELNCHTDSNLPSRNDKNINTTPSAINTSHPMELPLHEDNKPSNLSTTLTGTSQASITKDLHLQNDPIEDHVEVEKTCHDTKDLKTSSRNNEEDAALQNISTYVCQGSAYSNLFNEDTKSLSVRIPPDNVDEINLIRHSSDEPTDYINKTSKVEPNQREGTGIQIVEGSNGSDSTDSSSLELQRDDRNSYDESLWVLSTNLQSTCVHFDVKKKFEELETVEIQEETDISDELEKLGDYEDFERPLLEEARRISEGED